MPSLNDSVVLLTGGATGIGRAIALDMAAAGATVAIGDTNIDDGQRTVEEILSAGGKASFRSCDVAEAEQVDRPGQRRRRRLRATRRAGQRRRHLRRVVSPP